MSETFISVRSALIETARLPRQADEALSMQGSQDRQDDSGGDTHRHLHRQRSGAVIAQSRNGMWTAGAIVTTLVVLYPETLFAAAVVDSSWGRTPQTLSGNFTIPEAKGKLAGSNLFHSFKSFSINSGESATFTTSTVSIRNVISRVSGNSASLINGPLSLQAAPGSAPNFFFINPNGVTFGAGAQVNVPASFHVSTANTLRFADGTVFSAGTGPDNTLSVAAPEAFGFLGSSAKVAFKGVQADGSSGHPAFAASKLDVTASAIQIDSSSIAIPNADVRLVATGKAATSVAVDGTPTLVPGGSITLKNSTIDSSTLGMRDAGSITLSGRNVQFVDSSLLANALFQQSPSGNAGAIDINAHNVGIVGQSRLAARPGSASHSGASSIGIHASGDVLLAPKSGSSFGPDISIFSASASSFFPGEISIEGRSVTIANTTMETNNIDVVSRPISIVSQGHLSLFGSTLDTHNGPGADGGPISLRSLNGGRISINTSKLVSNASSSSAGPIQISTTGQVSITDSSVLAESTGFFGKFWTIDIKGGQISIGGDSVVSVSKTGGQSNSAIRLTASKSISIERTSTIEARGFGSIGTPGLVLPGEIRLTTPKLALDGTISTETSGNLRASSIIVEAPAGTSGALSITSSLGTGVMTAGVVNTGDASCTTCGTGSGGVVQINAAKLALSGVELLSEAGPGTSGNAGSVEINAGTGAVIKHAQISADTSGQGGAGKVSITGKSLWLENTNASSSARTGATGSAGDIAINAHDTLLLRKSQINATAQTSNGGDITVSSGRLMALDNALISSSVFGASGNAGDLALSADTLILRTGFIQANTVAVGGVGGDITIGRNRLIPIGPLFVGGTTPVAFQPGLGINVIQAAAPNGIPGTVNFTAP